MYRVIKASFGLNDRDWIDPDDVYEAEDYYLIWELHPPIICEDGYIQNTDWSRFECYDLDTGLNVVDDPKKIIEVALEDEIPEFGKFEISGKVLIPYQIYYRTNVEMNLSDIYLEDIKLTEI